MNDIEASKTWWNTVKSDPEALRAWLYDQYRGEVTAGGRITALRDTFASPGTKEHRVLTVIAAQEREHGTWVGELLRARGFEVRIEEKQDRYWRETMPAIDDLETGAAVGAHAEGMRLARIEAIVADADTPHDIRETFARILPQERFHERAFRRLTTEAALARTAAAHDLGRRVLGLVP